jgi:hypothetical protein
MRMLVPEDRERVRRREFMADNRAALKNGQTYEEFRAAHEQRVQRWINLFHSEMEKVRTDDPCEVLPEIAARLEESAIAAARAVATREAKEIVTTMLRKAIA